MNQDQKNFSSAFTSVKPVTTLNIHKTGSMSRSSQSNESNSKADWPAELQIFVKKCFETVRSEDISIMEAQLKSLITQLSDNNKIWTSDWNVMSLPILESYRNNEPGLFNRIDTSSNQAKKEGKHKLKKRRSVSEIYSKELVNEDQKQKRQRRFDQERINVLGSYSSSEADDYNSNHDPNKPFIGRCTNLEKTYLRLTSAPDPATVRPLNILRKTLELLKQKWKEEQNYSYICDQFKSMRQDLTVQRIQNEFTVEVYEIHGRIALEKGDLGEYNQCQSQLSSLYQKGIKGHDKEFLAYKILYLIHTQNRSDISELLCSMNNEELVSEEVQHALAVNTALSNYNYHKLFQLYNNAPNMGDYVMDFFIPRERIKALEIMCKSYRNSVSFNFIYDELAFLTKEECLKFLSDKKLDKYLEEIDNSKSKEIDNGDGDDKTRDTINFKFNTRIAIADVERVRQQAFRKVDIKGQL